MKSDRVLVMAVCSMFLVACGGGGDTGAVDNGGSGTGTNGEGVHSVVVTPATVSTYWGLSSQLQFSALDANGQTVSGAVAAWSTESPAIATVAETGVVSHLSPGETNIRASIGSVSGSAVARVLGFQANSLRVSSEDNCALSEDGADIWCWGDGYPLYDNRASSGLSQLTYPHPLRVDVSGVAAGGFKQIAPGFPYSCALHVSGDAYCWGDASDAGNLGTGDALPYEKLHKVLQGELPSGVVFSKLQTNYQSACGVGADGELYCWGQGGSLAKPAQSQPSSVYGAPVRMDRGVIPAVELITDVVANVNDTCVLAGGQPYCATTRSTFRLLDDLSAVPSGVRFTRIKQSAGRSKFYGLLADNGWLYHFGGGFGRRYGAGSDASVDDGSTVLALGRGAIPVGVRLVDFSVGGIAGSSCAIGDNGKAYCWGNGERGALGDGDTSAHESLLPVVVVTGDVPEGVRLVSIECGDYHCTAMGDDRRPYAWGGAEGAATGQDSGGNLGAPKLVSTVDLR